MKILRPHPVATAVISTMLVALALVVLLMWQGSTAEHHRPRNAAAVSVTTPSQDPPVRIAYPAANADPSQNYADLFLPKNYTGLTGIPVVALVHGGSWAKGVSARSFDHLAHDLTTRGIAVYNVEYRRVGTGGGWPTTFTDVGAALDNLPAVAQRYPQLTLNNSVLVGHSAGAQLAAWAGLRTAHEPSLGLGAPRWTPSSIISISGPLDMRMSATHGDTRITRVLGGSPVALPARYQAVDPIQMANRSDANGPTIIAVHGTHDHLVSDLNSVSFIAQYLAHGGHGELKLLPGATHTSMFHTRSSTYRALVQLIADTARQS